MNKKSKKEISLIHKIINDQVDNDKLSNFNIIAFTELFVPTNNQEKSILKKLLQNHIINDITDIVQQFLIVEIVWKSCKEGEERGGYAVINDNIILCKQSMINGKLNGTTLGLSSTINTERIVDLGTEVIDYKEYKIKYIAHYLDRRLHRDDGPAIIYDNSAKYYYRYDKLHREDGPAVESANGYKCWYQHNKLHRIDDAAMEYINDQKVYYHYGNCVLISNT